MEICWTCASNYLVEPHWLLSLLQVFQASEHRVWLNRNYTGPGWRTDKVSGDLFWFPDSCCLPVCLLVILSFSLRRERLLERSYCAWSGWIGLEAALLLGGNVVWGLKCKGFQPHRQLFPGEPLFCLALEHYVVCMVATVVHEAWSCPKTMKPNAVLLVNFQEMSWEKHLWNRPCAIDCLEACSQAGQVVVGGEYPFSQVIEALDADGWKGKLLIPLFVAMKRGLDYSQWEAKCVTSWRWRTLNACSTLVVRFVVHSCLKGVKTSLFFKNCATTWISLQQADMFALGIKRVMQCTVWRQMFECCRKDNCTGAIKSANCWTCTYPWLEIWCHTWRYST